MDGIVGGIVTLGIGVIVIAGIYQLGKSANPIVPSATSAYNNTLTSLFK
jgi:hypothetical protein